MRPFIFVVLVLLLAAPPLFAQQLKTGDGTYVTATVEPLTGLITIRRHPGTNFDPILSYPQKSFLYVMVGDRIFTNNNIGVNVENDPRYGGFLSNGVNQKIADTIRTTWANKNGCDIIQEVYPVKLDASAQIVMRWKVKNNSNTPLWGQAQFLLDVQTGAQNPNDGGPILTRYGYRPIWEQYTSSSSFGVPWLFASFEFTMPNAPSFTPGITGVGYTQDINYKLGLKRPTKMTIGDWGAPLASALVDNLWGVSGSTPWGSSFADAAILLEWDGVGVATGKTMEIARTSYGTGEFGVCADEMLSLVFYPRRFRWRAPKYQPDTATVDLFSFNIYSPIPQDPNYGPPSSDVSLTLHAGPNLRIIHPDTGNISQKEQRQLLGPANGYIPQYGVGTAHWQIVADAANDCTGSLDSWLLFTGEGRYSANKYLVDTCTLPLMIDCIQASPPDIFPPYVSANLPNQLDTLYSFYTVDNRQNDSGIMTIVINFDPGDSSKIVAVKPPLVPCSKDTHRVSIVSKRPIFGGMIEWIVTDCAGNVTQGSVLVDFIENIPPEIVSRSDTGAIKTMVVKDAQAGLESITFPDLDSTRFTVSVTPTIVPCYPFEHTITVQDKGGKDPACVYLKIRDCQANTTNDSICFPGTVGVEHETSSASVFELIGNPASKQTLLRLKLATSRTVNISILDMTGRTLATMSPGMLPSGVSDIPISITDLTAGTYYIVAEWDGRQFAKKLSVIK